MLQLKISDTNKKAVKFYVQNLVIKHSQAHKDKQFIV